MASEQMRPKMARLRARRRVHQNRLDPKRLIFIDETSIKTNKTPTRGWRPRSERLTVLILHGHWKTLPVLAGPRHDSIVAPFGPHEPIKGDAFTAWADHFPASTPVPGHIVIAGNPGSHKTLPARQPIRNAGAHLMFPPPSPPGPHPIERVFAELKTLF